MHHLIQTLEGKMYEAKSVALCDTRCWIWCFYCWFYFLDHRNHMNVHILWIYHVNPSQYHTAQQEKTSSSCLLIYVSDDMYHNRTGLNHTYLTILLSDTPYYLKICILSEPTIKDNKKIHFFKSLEIIYKLLVEKWTKLYL